MPRIFVFIKITIINFRKFFVFYKKVAKNIIFYDEPWTPSDKEQAEDRIYRIGTNDSVNIYTLLTKQTVDEKVNNILYTKKNISNFIVDNKLEMDKGGKLLDFLLE